MKLARKGHNLGFLYSADGKDKVCRQTKWIGLVLGIHHLSSGQISICCLTITYVTDMLSHHNIHDLSSGQISMLSHHNICPLQDPLALPDQGSDFLLSLDT
jgi:hypothetical protein